MTLHDFIKAYGDRHITQASFEFWTKAENDTDAGNPNLIIYMFGGSDLYACTAVALGGTDMTTKHSITVVAHGYRNRGIGRFLLNQKIAECARRGWSFTTAVATDNFASMALCSHLHTIEEVTRHRESGEYNALICTPKP